MRLPLSTPTKLLSTIPLFAEIPARERDHLARVMRRFSAPAGTAIFHEGDRGDQMYLIDHGLIRIERRTPDEVRTLALMEPGSVFGELSLMGSGLRTATAVAAEDSGGWLLDRTAFEVLRADPRRGTLDFIRCIGDVAVKRLQRRYEAIADALDGPADRVVATEPLMDEPAEPGELAYLRGTLFFSRLSEAEIGALVRDVRRVRVPRGTLLCGGREPPKVLYVVVRGAIETTIRRGDHARRVRLAGPGRAVGHLGVLGPDAPSVGEFRAREHAVLLVVPWERAHALLVAGDGAARGFTAAFNEDVVRALIQADRPTPRMVSGGRDKTHSVGAIAALAVASSRAP